MDLTDSLTARRPSPQAPLIDPSLHGDMRLRFQLQITVSGIGEIIVLQSAFDIDGVRVMPFDEIAVVAVHGPHQAGKRPEHAFGQAPPKSRRFLRQFQGQIGQSRPMARRFPDAHRLHQRNHFFPISDRF